MGCAFDSFSTTWSDRSYILTLLVLAWLIPLVSNILFYIAMLHRVRNSDFQYYAKKHRTSECYSMFNIDNRVSHILDHKIQRSLGFKFNIHSFFSISIILLSTGADGNETSKNGLYNIACLVCRLDTICSDEFLGYVLQWNWINAGVGSPAHDLHKRKCIR